MKFESIYKEYIHYSNHYTNYYNYNKICILMQIGSFYEIYDNGDNIDKMQDISNILNIILTRKDKSNTVVSDKNNLLIGFPCISLSKYLPKLTENDYIVVVIEQKKNGKIIERFVKDIYSPGINLETNSIDNYTSSNWIGCAFIEDYSNISVSVLDIYTGEINIHNIITNNDLDSVINNLCKINSMYNLKEMLVISNEPISKCKNIFKLVIHKKITYYKLSEINEILNKIYPITLISPVEQIGLEKLPDCINSLIEILKYAHEHNENITKFIKEPNIILDSNILYLDNNCISRLDIHYLIKILNRCNTNHGKREFTQRILFPSQNKDLIITRLNKIEYFNNVNKCDIESIKKILKNTKDIPLILRKLFINNDNTNTTCYLSGLYKTVVFAVDIIKLISNNTFNKLFDIKEVVSELENTDIIYIFDKYFNFNNTDLYNFVLKSNDTIELYNLVEILQNSVPQGFDIDIYNGKWYIICNNTKSNKEYLKDNKLLSKIYEHEFYIKDFVLTSTKTTIKLENDIFNNLIINIKQKLNKLYINYLNFFINNYLVNFRNVLDTISKFIIEIDITLTNWCNSIEYHYNKPYFNETDVLEIKDIRHPIIEIVNNKSPYISNNIKLVNGVLLYGINSIGKSSLIKSIGLNAIMAQSGMYTASSQYNSFIIDKIYTRFPSSDNIIEGKSSFIIEIEDIRNILKFSTNKTLILADEICQSTETYSGVSIIAATIKSLCDIECKFIIASHLHELVELDLIKNNSKLQIKHLSITNSKNGVIIFDRKLKDGPFHSLYGLEICKSLGMSDEFIQLTESIRKKLINYTNPFILKKSKYNSNVFYKDSCQICDKTNVNFHIHHILPQNLANEYGNIGDMNKDDKFNLVTLCGKCHHLVHDNKIKIYNYIFTVDGIKLNWCSV